MDKIWLVYIRKSVVREDTDLESPERQLHICKLRIDLLEGDNPYNIEIYKDLDRSGSNEDGRPDWLRLKEQLHRPEVVGIVASSLDRLYRNVSEFLSFLNQLEGHNKALITAKENLDTTSPLGRFVVTILMALFEMEWRLTSQRMTEMVAYKRQEQGRHWGPTPFGCARDENGQLIPHPSTYNVLLKCFELYASDNHTYLSAAKHLQANGYQYTDRYGNIKPFTKENLREILARWRLYRGDLPLGNPRKGDNLQWVEGGHAPILPVELCDRVGEVLQKKSKSKHSRRGGDTPVHLLSDVLYCGECGGKLIGVHDRGLRRYRHKFSLDGCPEKWISADQAETSIMKAILELFEYSNLLMEVKRELKSSTQEAVNIDSFREQTLKAKLERLEDIYLDGEIEKGSYIERRGTIIRDLAELQVTTQKVDHSNIVGQILSSFHYILSAEPPTKKAIINNLIDRLEVKNNEITHLSPQAWASPFFRSCCRWAEWESNPHEG